MSNSVHILNGDALGDRFPEEISGERIILRECLCYGPVEHENLNSLHEIRSDFLKGLEPSHDYHEYVKPELEKLTEIPLDSEVYCWFEEDLFCQVNFWFSVHLASKRTKNISLVFPKSDLVYGFSALDGSELKEAMGSAIQLTKEDIQSISDIWKAYSRTEIAEALSIAEANCSTLPFLKEAIEAWIGSIPNENSAGKPLQVMLEISEELGTEDFRKIFPVFHRRCPIYGYGDLIAQDIWEKRNG